MGRTDQIRKRFAQNLALYGADDTRAVEWGTRETQYFRFKILCDIAPLFEKDSSTVLDYGCGVGDLREYLRFQGFLGTYHGVDISPDLIRAAKKKYGSYPRTSFAAIDAARDVKRGRHDWIFLSGVFNPKYPGVEEECKKTLRELFARAGKGLAYNGISNMAQTKSPSLWHADPFALTAWCAQNLTPSVTLRHDYRGGNFTIYLYKNQGVDF